MIVLELKSMSSPDVEPNGWIDDRSDVLFLLELEIGAKGEEACDLFQCVVATPTGLSRLTPNESSLISDRAKLVFVEFSWTRLHDELRRILRRCEALSFSESVARLQRYFEWEYED